MILSDVAQMLKNGFTHDEILEIFRGKTEPVGGTPVQDNTAVIDTDNNSQPVTVIQDETIKQLQRENSELLERMKLLESRMNVSAVQASEGDPITPAEPDLKEIMESLIK